MAVAIGLNAMDEKVKALYDAGVRVFVLDTAHGYQKAMIESIAKFRKICGEDVILVAGNVITAEATQALIKAGANGVKV